MKGPAGLLHMKKPRLRLIFSLARHAGNTQISALGAFHKDIEMLKEMTVKALKAFYKSMNAADLRVLDDHGGRLAWCHDQGFQLNLGCPHNRAMHEQTAALPSISVGEGWQESRSTSKQTRTWLLENAEGHFDSLVERAEAAAEQ